MNGKITIFELATLLAEKHGIGEKESESFLRSIFNVIEDALITDKYVKIKGFGTFKLTEVSSRKSVDVNTGEPIEIQGHNKVTFTPDAKIKDLVNRPFSHFETVVLNDNVKLEELLTEETEIENENEVVSEDSFVEEIPEEKQVEETPEEKPSISQEEFIQEDSVQEPTQLITTPLITEVETTVEEQSESFVEQTVMGEAETTPPPEEETLLSMPEEPRKEEYTIVSKKKKNKSYGWTICLVLLFLFVGITAWYFLTKEKAPSPIVIKEPAIKHSVPVKTDTIKVQVSTKESSSKNPNENNPVLTQVEADPKRMTVTPLPTAVAKESLADTTEYKITGLKANYTLKEGETLARIALKFYGNKKLWPYIALYNKDQISNVNKVVPGMTVRVPELIQK